MCFSRQDCQKGGDGRNLTIIPGTWEGFFWMPGDWGGGGAAGWKWGVGDGGQKQGHLTGTLPDCFRSKFSMVSVCL